MFKVYTLEGKIITREKPEQFIGNYVKIEPGMRKVINYSEEGYRKISNIAEANEVCLTRIERFERKANHWSIENIIKNIKEGASDRNKEVLAGYFMTSKMRFFPSYYFGFCSSGRLLNEIMFEDSKIKFEYLEGKQRGFGFKTSVLNLWNQRTALYKEMKLSEEFEKIAGKFDTSIKMTEKDKRMYNQKFQQKYGMDISKWNY